MKTHRIDHLCGEAYVTALHYVKVYVIRNYNVHYTVKDNASELELIARMLSWKFNENGERIFDTYDN